MNSQDWPAFLSWLAHRTKMASGVNKCRNTFQPMYVGIATKNNVMEQMEQNGWVILHDDTCEQAECQWLKKDAGGRLQPHEWKGSKHCVFTEAGIQHFAPLVMAEALMHVHS